MKGHTYRYFEGEPLYPFGYGLSYTSFNYSGLLTNNSSTTKDSIQIQIDVKNTGSCDGDEVVQLYLRHMDAPVPVPIHALQGFKRVHLNKGEIKTVTFRLGPLQLAVIDDNNQRVVLPGTIQLFLGGEQPDKKNLSQRKVLMKEIDITGEKYIIDQLNK